MTPAARIAAAIDVLEVILVSDQVAEKALTNWARSNRYAGSKDRAAVRDLTYDCLRSLRSYGHASGDNTARGIMLGHLLTQDLGIDAVFTGEGYGPSALSEEERARVFKTKPQADAPTTLDFPDWLEPELTKSLGGDLGAAMAVLQSRAPVDLRVNLAKSTVSSAKAKLAKDGIETVTLASAPAALRLTQPSRKILNSEPYKNGVIELQDAGSQALVDGLPLDGVKTVLDYCAGGGGKSLALAARASNLSLSAYDISSARMQDLSVRAKRAGAKITVLDKDPVQSKVTFDLVFLDVPCSGSGAWRRSPDAKWRFTPEALDKLRETQQGILQNCQNLVGENGHLVYMTCSIFRAENQRQIEKFLSVNPDWEVQTDRNHSLLEGTDGFYSCHLRRK